MPRAQRHGSLHTCDVSVPLALVVPIVQVDGIPEQLTVDRGASRADLDVERESPALRRIALDQHVHPQAVLVPGHAAQFRMKGGAFAPPVLHDQHVPFNRAVGLLRDNVLPSEDDPPEQSLRRIDVALEIRPRLERILHGKGVLDLGEFEVRGEEVRVRLRLEAVEESERLAARGVPRFVRAEQFPSLVPQLSQAGTRRKRPGHDDLLSVSRPAPAPTGGKKVRIVCLPEGDLWTFRRSGGSLQPPAGLSEGSGSASSSKRPIRTRYARTGHRSCFRPTSAMRSSPGQRAGPSWGTVSGALLPGRKILPFHLFCHWGESFTKFLQMAYTRNNPFRKFCQDRNLPKGLICWCRRWDSNPHDLSVIGF